jgi:peptidoglycan/LPS O-acetylase OafA/YrhL
MAKSSAPYDAKCTKDSETSAQAEASAQAGGGRKAPGRQRLAWLDALRGIAALCVVYEHFGARVLVSADVAVHRIFDPGLYGVLVFFLISGYIVPATLEQRRELRSFWISRLFRLFPLFALAIGITVVFGSFGLANLAAQSRNVGETVLAHLLMLSDLLTGPNLIVVIWTLSYEMVFYLLLTALFTVRLHRRSGTLAVIFVTGALVLGGCLPFGWISGTLGKTQVALAADVLVIAGLAVAVAFRGLPRALGAWLAAGTGVTLVVFNGTRSAYEGLTILALMFTGTLLYRAQHGQISRARGIMLTVGIFATAITAGVWHPPFFASYPETIKAGQWIMSVALAGLTFASGLAVQNMRVPRLLSWLGLVSYSVYLIFPLLLDVYDKIPFPQSYHREPWEQAGVAVVYVLVLLSCAAAAYHLIELPMQRLGRRLAARSGRRLPQPALAT